MSNKPLITSVQRGNLLKIFVGLKVNAPFVQCVLASQPYVDIDRGGTVLLMRITTRLIASISVEPDLPGKYWYYRNYGTVKKPSVTGVSPLLIAHSSKLKFAAIMGVALESICEQLTSPRAIKFVRRISEELIKCKN